MHILRSKIQKVGLWTESSINFSETVPKRFSSAYEAHERYFEESSSLGLYINIFKILLYYYSVENRKCCSKPNWLDESETLRFLSNHLTKALKSNSLSNFHQPLIQRFFKFEYVIITSAGGIIIVSVKIVDYKTGPVTCTHTPYTVFIGNEETSGAISSKWIDWVLFYTKKSVFSPRWNVIIT